MVETKPTLRPRISVVLTIYNMEQCLEECLDSIANQTYEDFEAICIDDGSTDNSSRILEAYADKDQRFSIFHIANQGVANARNIGIEKATGEYLLLLDSDDIFDKSFFEKMVESAIETGSDVAICRSCQYDHVNKQTFSSEWVVKKAYLPERESFSPSETKGCILTAFMGWPWDKLYKTSFIFKEGLRFPLMPNSEDLYFVYLALVKATKLSIVDEVLIKHRVNRGDSVSNSRLNHPLCFYEGTVKLKEELKKNPALYSSLEWGFLNWALDYACWNIQSLPQSNERTMLVNMLFEDGFPALETQTHPLEYFSLYKDLPSRFMELQSEYENRATGQHNEANRPDEIDPSQESHNSFWALLASLFSSFDQNGFTATIKLIMNRKMKSTK